MKQTPEQEAACAHMRKSPKNLAIQAYAGTGKTTTIEDMVKVTSSREKVLALAFNKTNAEDLRARLPRRVESKTLHGLSYAALQRSRAAKLEIDASRQRWIVERVVPYGKYEIKAVRSGVRKLLSLAMNTLTLDREGLVELLWGYGVLPEKGVSAEMMAHWTALCLEESRKPDSCVSYDDMVFLAAVENIRTGAFDVSFLDEAQDANRAQKRVLLNSVRPGGKIVIVGDRHQAIYAWRGASMSAFDELVEELHADVLPLSVTFRCPRRVVELARCLVPEYSAPPEAPEGRVRWASEKELYARVQPGHAVIARSNWALGRVSLQLLRMGKRPRIVGKDHFEMLQTLINRAEARDVKGLLAWLGPYVAEETEKFALAGKEERGEQLAEAAELLRALCEGMNTIQNLLSRIAYLFDEDDGLERIRLSTVHRAKGLQWGNVWLMESTFSVDSDEGANLYYVAITRVLGWNADGNLWLVQSPRRDGKIPPSIAMDLLPPETVERWELDEAAEGEDE